MVLGEDSYGYSGDKYFWSLSYSSAKTAQKRMDKLEKAGIRCKLTGYNSGCIEFLGYTPETEALLEKERQVVVAHREFCVVSQTASVKIFPTFRITNTVD